MQRPVASGRERWRLHASSEKCWLAHYPSTVRIRLSSSPRTGLLAVISRTTDRDGDECGGLLFGAADRDFFEVLGASGPGPQAIRTPDAYRPDVEDDLSLVDQMESAGLAPIGIWHTHPAGSAAPSPEDLAFFARWRRGLGIEQLLALIAVPSEDGWSFEPFVVRAGFGRDRCEPARSSL
jgi:proteasome lid subunit RPN8/RPN11